jgi:hypothetical protein
VIIAVIGNTKIIPTTLKNNNPVKKTIFFLLIFSLLSEPLFSEMQNPLVILRQLFNPQLKTFKSKTKKADEKILFLRTPHPETADKQTHKTPEPTRIELSDEEELALQQELTKQLRQLEKQDAFMLPAENPEWSESKNFERMLAHLFCIDETPQTIGVLNISKFYDKRNTLKPHAIIREINATNKRPELVFKFLILTATELEAFCAQEEVVSLLPSGPVPWITFILNNTSSYLGSKTIDLPTIDNFLIIPNTAELFARYAAHKNMLITKNVTHATPEWRETAFKKITMAISRALKIKIEREMPRF